MSCSHCGNTTVLAKGLCRACYQRQKKTGSLEYKRVKNNSHCSSDGCFNPVVARGYCEGHYRLVLRYGDDISSFGYGERKSHHLYASWAYQARCSEGRVAEWNDFWAFVSHADNKPSGTCKPRRNDHRKPWGPDNFYWMEPIGSSENRKEYAQKWRARNRIASKGHSLQKQYGMSIDDYMEMYANQGGRCAICETPKNAYTENDSKKSGKTETLAVDHCHTTGKIRGLLCSSCNKGIGHFNDSPAMLGAAAKYLESCR